MTFKIFQNTALLRLRLFLTALGFVLFVAGQVTAQDRLRILAMGDSMLATNKSSQRNVTEVLRRALRATVVDRSVSGARMIYNLPLSGELGFNIPKQYRKGDWDWIVLNGGGNDLLFGCGCMRCETKLNQLIGDTGQSGKIVELVTEMRQTGAKVIYVGYLHTPGTTSGIEHCQDEGHALERRISAMAEHDDGVYFVSLVGLVPDGDRSYHSADLIHPSIKGSRAIGRRIARQILLREQD